MSIEDRAQEHEARMWEAINLNRPTLPSYSPGEAGYGPAECSKCDEPMPPQRRADGCKLCTACQSLAERSRLRR